MLRYVIPAFSSTLEFLQHLSRRQGRLKKGGVPDNESAARILLQDWIDGRLSYYTIPPAVHKMPLHMQSTIVGELNAAFDIDALLQDEEQKVLEGLPASKVRHLLLLCTIAFVILPQYSITSTHHTCRIALTLWP